MLKKKKNRQTAPRREEKPATLGDLINKEMMEKLKNQQKELKEQEEKKKQEEAARKREEQRLKEKNKTFEELLSDSDMDWKKFK